MTSIGGVVYKKFTIFEIFVAYLSEFLIFLRVFLVARSYRVLVIKSRVLIMGALVTQETRLKVPCLAVFCDFGYFLGCLFCQKSLA